MTFFLKILPLTILPLVAQVEIPKVDFNGLSLSWQGLAGMDYEIWHSTNLNNFSNSGLTRSGEGTHTFYVSDIYSPAPERAFFQLRFNPDTDGDGITNDYELKIGLDPEAVNSVSDLITQEVDSRIAGKDPLDSMEIFDNYVSNGSNLIFNRNPDCWINDLDNISCISPWNSQDNRRRAGTLITPRHVIVSAHYPISDNSKIM